MKEFHCSLRPTDRIIISHDSIVPTVDFFFWQGEHLRGSVCLEWLSAVSLANAILNELAEIGVQKP